MSEMKLPLGMSSETAFLADSSKYSKKYYVYVEGSTDKVFYCRILKDGIVQCRSVAEATKSDLCFRDPTSNKKTIVKSLLFSQSPPFFGIVDRDYDTKSSGGGVFYTDTRDLETLLVFSDVALYSRIGCQVEYDDVKKALFMAYQWGYVKDAFGLHKNDSSQRDSMIDGIEVCFNSECQLCIDSLREHLKKVISHYPSNQDVKKFCSKEKKITGTSWNITRNVIDWTVHSDVWSFINGHDMLYFLKKVNQSVYDKYGNQVYGLEYAIINNYDVFCFRTTELYRLLNDSDLVKI